MSLGTKKETKVSVEGGRQSTRFLNRLAFWAFFLITFLSGGITLALTLTSGAPSRDIVVLTVASLLATILTAIRVRWMPLLSILFSLAIFYLVLSEAFVLEHLSSPKAPQGGLGTFIGDIIIIGCNLVAFIASLGAVIQNFRSEDNRIPRWVPTALNIVVGMVIGAILIGIMAQPPNVTSAGVTYTNNVPTVHMTAGSFSVPLVIIPKGSKLMLQDDVAAVHILENGSWQNGTPKTEQEPGAPLVHDLQVNGNSVEVGPFPVSGTYHIYCSVHPGMNLTIIVQ